MNKEELKAEIKLLPDKPGIYQYYDNKNEIIYVGKAKNLRKRVSSYFTKINEGKTKVLVKNIFYIKYIIVNTEEEALLLENNLIKTHQPRYNVLLKDDKTYPSICITKEDYPRIFKTRTINKKLGDYFGPYTSVGTINLLLNIIKQLYNVRSCKFLLNKETIAKKRYKVCLDYHIKKCKGPCENLQSREDYNREIDEIRKILKGDADEISKLLFAEMKHLANQMKFEEAEEIKRKYLLIENFKSKSIIANTILYKTDVFGYYENENSAYITLIRVNNGAVVQGYTIEYKKKIDETKEDLLSSAIIELRQRLDSNTKNIVIPFQINYHLNDTYTTIPIKGDKKKLLDFATQNAKQYMIDKLKKAEKLNPEQKQLQLLTTIKNRLNLPKTPIHIECFDNSNTQGTNPVAGCVVYLKGKASKRNYRKYNIKTVIGADDYASMKEVVKRRYTRIINEESQLPDLIVADGGAGQMNMIQQVIDELKINIPIVGLAKNEKHKTKEILIGNPIKHIELRVTDPMYKFFGNMQEEVHRYAITFHKNKRSKTLVQSELDNIKGIGEKSKNSLISHFKSIKRLQNAKKSDIEKIIGTHRASIIYDYFHKDLSL